MKLGKKSKKNRKKLYENLEKLENIEKAYFNVLKNINSFNNKKYLKINKSYYIGKIEKIIKNKEYKPGKKRKFYINESGKRREIYAQSLLDKMINNLVSLEILYKIIIDSLIDQNIASRPFLGTKAGKNIFFKYIADSNFEWKKYYILKGDIHKFFESIDHDILKQKLKKKIFDKKALNILFNIIDSDKKGLSLGSMTSQTLAIFYLNDFDHYIKESLKVKKYIRYQDDFLIFVKTKKEAKEILEKIKKFLEKEKLELNKSTRIYSSSNNFKFIGITKKGKHVRSKNAISKINKKLKKYKKGEISLGSILSTLSNYYFKIGNQIFKSNLTEKTKDKKGDKNGNKK